MNNTSLREPHENEGGRERAAKSQRKKQEAYITNDTCDEPKEANLGSVKEMPGWKMYPKPQKKKQTFLSEKLTKQRRKLLLALFLVV